METKIINIEIGLDNLVLGIYDRIMDIPKQKQQELYMLLINIHDLLINVKNSFEKETVPKYEGKQLLVLLAHSDKFKKTFKKKLPELSAAFESGLKKIADLLLNADFYTDKKKRLALHHNVDTENPKFRHLAKSYIFKACEEIEGAAGTILAYSKIFKQ